MKKLFSNFKFYKKEMIIAPLFKMLEAFFELLVPIVVSSIIDKGINGSGGITYVVYMCLLLLALAVVGLACSLLAQYYAAKAAVGFSKKTRNDLFNKIQHLSFSEIDTLGTSAMITRMTSDVNQVQNGVNLVLRLFLRSPVVVFGAIIMAFIVDATAALVFAVEVPILAIVVLSIIVATIPLYKNVQNKLENVLTSTRENLTGVRVIRAFSLEKEETKVYDKKNNDLFIEQKKVGLISGLMNPLTYVIVNIAIIVLIYVGGLEVNAGSLSQGEVVALYNYMSQILIELIKFANLIITVTKAIASGKRLESVLEMQSTLKHGQNTSTTKMNDCAVEFKNVNFRYASAAADSLSNISFKVKQGETIGIIGGTGSGKTSLISLIPHFYDATSGAVFVDGKNVSEYDDVTLRNKIGIVMQKAVLFKGTIRDNIKWGKDDATDEEITSAIKVAQASDVVRKKKEGLDYQVEQLGKNFSGGQKQRLTIARALVKKPEILVLDDSSSALDYATDAALRTSLQNLDYHPTVFIVSQRTSSIQHADKIIVLDDGKIDGIGTHDELLNTSKIYQEIYYSQYKEEDNNDK